ncbi:MAG: hypothetical protein-transmembrane region and signal peptide prediction [uncultured Rubrobacteraceae bacterium]|uniref:DUF1772 domain-containing protein n=1 Tax=uncultured Rubrobacteraceae bacterium TaxID=349277 RepID=A0A6J4R7L1_9ACTN|nr:MAG: hypothetical protein-transmembrane region and signal peptide prediction [uncultured Rubrobacteraceae bacterium]
MEAVLLVHLAATVFMVGLIWFVQIVHYPLFGLVGRDGFARYSAAHSRLTGFVVGPPMLVEAATAVALAVSPPQGVSFFPPLFGLALLAVVWISTAFLQSPQHGVLGGGFVPGSHRFLVRSNWIRTVCWTGRGLLVLWMTAGAMSGA